MASSPSSSAPSFFQGKVIALTGGASGIGWATVQLLYDRGAKISIADVDQDALDAAAAYFNHGDLVNSNERVLLKKVDVSVAKEVDEWIAETVKRFHRLDGAANMAGVIGRHHGVREVGELEDAEWERILGVNLTGMMFSLRAEVREMVRLKEQTEKERDQGREESVGEGKSIVCVSSIQGKMGFARHAAYAASKVRTALSDASFLSKSSAWGHDDLASVCLLQETESGSVETILTTRPIELQLGTSGQLKTRIWSLQRCSRSERHFFKSEISFVYHSPAKAFGKEQMTASFL